MNERFNWKIFIHIFFDLHRSKFHINFEISQFKNLFLHFGTYSYINFMLAFR